MCWFYDNYCLQLKEVRREVQLSRRRSIKLKAQVDKLQENRDGPGWSQHRETVKVTHTAPGRSAHLHNSAGLLYFIFCLFLSQVTEEVLSILRLLSPLTEFESSPPPPSRGENRLDKSLSQLQNVARLLAIGHTQQVEATPTEIKLLALIRSISGWVDFSGHVTRRNVCFAHTRGTKAQLDRLQLR